MLLTLLAAGVFDATPVIVVPTGEPITLDEAKQQCRITDDSDDELIARYIRAARAWVESYTGIRLVARTETFVLTSLGARLPTGPIRAITGIAHAGGTVDPVLYVLGGSALYPTLSLVPGAGWFGPVTITAQTGFADAADVPEDLKHAMLMLVAFWFDNRSTVNVGNITTTLPFGADALCAAYKRWAV